MEIVSSVNDLRFDVEQSIPARFAQVAEQFPDSPAIAGVAGALTYAQLAAAAGAVADEIYQTAGSPEPGPISQRIAVIARHDAPLLIAVLGILLSGRAVVVLHASDPAERLRRIVEDTQPQLLLADRSHYGVAETIAPATRILQIGNAAGPQQAQRPSPLWKNVRSIPPAGLAWLIATSGSTGRPKAVMQTHRNILHNVCRLSYGMSIASNDRIALTSALSTAQGLSTLWCALLNGAASCPFPVPERGVTGFADWIQTHCITVLVVAGTVYRQVLKTLADSRRLEHVRMLRLSAESATPADFVAFQKHLSPDAALFHALSSSETGNITQHLMRPSDPLPAGNALPVGRPSPQMTLLLLDGDGKPVAPGEVGEIVVRSPYISPGYWNNPALTEERFSAPDGPDGPRLYRTGDRACLNAGGLLEYLGRKDSQLKIHGHRVEIGEIEAALGGLPQVERAAVVPFQEPDAEAPQLAAFIVCRPEHAATADELRTVLRARLPAYMVPARMLLIGAFPLTPSGKLDRQALLAVLAQAPSPEPELSAQEQPRSPTEERLAAMWSAALRRKAIGRSSDFFSLGGDSLSAATISALVHSAFGGVTLDLRAFADHPRLSNLAGLIDSLPRQAGAAAVPIPRRSSSDTAPLSFTQERIWNHSRNPGGSAGYTVTACHLLRGPLDVDALRHAMQVIQARHEMIRTTFHASPGGPVQRRHPTADVPFDLPLHDFSHHPNPEKEASAFFQAQAAAPFDLAKLPLLRFSLLRLAPGEHWLLRINHHILCDAASWQIYFRELAAIYEARVSGKPSPLPMETGGISYADYAAWQREQFNPETRDFAAAIDWWKDRFTPMPPELILPFRRSKSLFARRPKVTAQDGIQWWGISGAAAQNLDTLAAQSGATYFMSRFAAFLSFLSRRTGQENLVVGTYAGNRTRLETQQVFGDFSSLVTLPFTLKRGVPFTGHLAAVKQAILDLHTAPRAEIPFDPLRMLVRSRGGDIPSPAAIFLISDHVAPLHFAGLEMTWRERISDAMQWGFTLSFTQHAESTANRAWFDPRLHDPEKVRSFVADFSRFLESDLSSVT